MLCGRGRGVGGYMARPLMTIEASSGSVNADRGSEFVCDLILVFKGSLTWGVFTVLNRVHLASTGRDMRGGRTSMTSPCRGIPITARIQILQRLGKIRDVHIWLECRRLRRGPYSTSMAVSSGEQKINSPAVWGFIRTP